MTDSQAPRTTDWAGLYRRHVDLLTALAGDLAPEQEATIVPATPAWTVRQVYAHLAGGPADTIAGRTEGAPGEAWTAEHVAEREGRPLAVLVEELNENAAAAGRAAQDMNGVVWDIATHHADLHEALGHGRLPDPLWAPVLDALLPRRAPALVGAADPYELFRGLFSRRSVAQLRALGLSEDDAGSLGVFGPRDDDQPVPA